MNSNLRYVIFDFQFLTFHHGVNDHIIRSYTVLSIVAPKSQSGVFGIPCGAENYLGRVEKTRFSTTWIKKSWENIKI